MNHIAKIPHQVRNSVVDRLGVPKEETISISKLLAALRTCGRTQDLESGKRFHLAAVESGHESNIYVATSAVDMYAKCGSMLDARRLFDTMHNRDVASWNPLLLGYVDDGQNEVALQLFSNMQANGIAPNGRSFMAALKACGNLAAKEQWRKVQGKLTKPTTLGTAMAIHSQASQRGYQSDVFVATNLIDVYAKCGDLTEARQVFDKMARPNVVTWTVMMLGYTINDEPEVALELFERMRPAGCTPDAQAFVAALKGCGSLAKKEEATQADNHGKLVKANSLDKGMYIHRQVESRGLCNIFVACALIDMYANCGSVVDARRVFDRLPYHDVVVWTALILGYAENGDADSAIDLFGSMKLAGFAPDAQCLLAVLIACGSTAALETGQGIHAEILRVGAETDPVIANSLVDFYGKCGSLSAAQQVFDSYADTRNEFVAWNSLMSGYSNMGDSKVVLDIFERMLAEGLQATSITFACILTACSHVGLVEKGEDYFEAMSSKYGVTPDVQHYACMVDLFSRSNHLDRALGLVYRMPFKAGEVIWTILLAASRKWKNVTVGRLAFEELVALNKKEASYYALMADLYASVGAWEEQSRVVKCRKAMRAWKEPGQSWWCEPDGTVHKFVAGERKHYQAEEIRDKLKQLKVELKKLNGEDNEDELSWGHSERLALGCALVNTQAGARVRIVKNLRVCDDCHGTFALISKVESRTIVCRDSSRFHVFEKGECSCSGFW